MFSEVKELRAFFPPNSVGSRRTFFSARQLRITKKDGRPCYTEKIDALFENAGAAAISPFERTLMHSCYPHRKWKRERERKRGVSGFVVGTEAPACIREIRWRCKTQNAPLKFHAGSPIVAGNVSRVQRACHFLFLLTITRDDCVCRARAHACVCVCVAP